MPWTTFVLDPLSQHTTVTLESDCLDANSTPVHRLTSSFLSTSDQVWSFVPILLALRRITASLMAAIPS